MAIKCPKCNVDNPDTVKFCGECGTQLPSIKDIGVTKTIETPAEEFTRGTTFAGRYEIIEVLGKGGMGTVYKVEDMKIGQDIALKLIKPEIASDKKTIERFRNELKTTRMISHRNVCRMFDLGDSEGTHFITMEYIPGEDLKSFIKRVGQIPSGKAISIATQVCEGLVEAHRLGVVHRDLKSSNIMIDKEGNARIMDFGIARYVRDKGLTGEGIIIGTPEYMSPEQAEAKEIDHRTDVYSLGVILYETVTGKLPFEGDSPLAIVMKQKGEAPKEPMKLNPQIPEELNRCILKCLKTTKEQRYQNVEDIIADLREIEEKITTAERVAPERKPITFKEIATKKNLKTLLVPALILVSLFAVIIIAKLVRENLFQKRAAPAVHEQITFSGKAHSPAVAPDGKFISYIEEPKAQDQRLCMKDLISGQSIEIFEAYNILYLSWFPDGSKVHFWASTEGKAANYSISRLGGAPISSQIGISTSVHAWSPDGSLSAYSFINSTDIKIKNNLIGDITSIPLNVSFEELWSIDWSPLGNFLLFLTVDNQGTHFIWTVTPEGKMLKQVYKNRIDIREARWSPKGDAIYFMTDDGFWKVRISPSTGEAKDPAFKFLSGLQPGSHFSITNDGKLLYYTKTISYSNLWRFGIEDHKGGKSISPQQLTTGTMFCESPSFSPNGKNIAFSKGDGTKSNIYLMPLEGGEAQQLTFMESLNLGPVWSPDGREIAFASTEGGSLELWKIRLFDKKLTHFEGTKIDYQLHLCWSPGPNILFQTLGMNNIHVLDPKTNEVVPLVKDAQGWMFSPRYSPDAKFIAFSWNRPPEKVWQFSSDGKYQKILEGKWNHGQDPVGWSSDGRWLYTMEAWSDPKSILRVDVQTGDFEKVIETTFNLMGPFWRRGVNLTPDGKNFIATVYENYSDVWVVKNFDPDIK